MPDYPLQPVPSRRAPLAGRDYRVGDLRGCREGRRGARHHLHRHPRSVRGEAHLHGARHQNSRGWRQTKEMQTRPYLVEKRKQMYQNFLIILCFLIVFLFIEYIFKRFPYHVLHLINCYSYITWPAVKQIFI